MLYAILRHLPILSAMVFGGANILIPYLNDEEFTLFWLFPAWLAGYFAWCVGRVLVKVLWSIEGLLPDETATLDDANLEIVKKEVQTNLSTTFESAFESEYQSLRSLVVFFLIYRFLVELINLGNWLGTNWDSYALLLLIAGHFIYTLKYIVLSK